MEKTAWPARIAQADPCSLMVAKNRACGSCRRSGGSGNRRICAESRCGSCDCAIHDAIGNVRIGVHCRRASAATTVLDRRARRLVPRRQFFATAACRATKPHHAVTLNNKKPVTSDVHPVPFVIDGPCQTANRVAHLQYDRNDVGTLEQFPGGGQTGRTVPAMMAIRWCSTAAVGEAVVRGMLLSAASIRGHGCVKHGAHTPNAGRLRNSPTPRSPPDPQLCRPDAPPDVIVVRGRLLYAAAQQGIQARGGRLRGGIFAGSFARRAVPLVDRYA